MWFIPVILVRTWLCLKTRKSSLVNIGNTSINLTSISIHDDVMFTTQFKVCGNIWQFDNIGLTLIWLSNVNEAHLLCVCLFWLDAVKHLLAIILDLRCEVHNNISSWVMVVCYLSSHLTMFQLYFSYLTTRLNGVDKPAHK